MIVWVRKSPVTREALNLFWRYIAKHEYDELVLYKLTSTADTVRFEDLKKFRVIRDIEELQ